MKKRPSLKYDNNCMVCGACKIACPNDCIQFKMNDINYVPYVVTDKCIECNICENVCKSINNYHGSEITGTSFYICACKNQAILDESSSGGMFTLIADYILENNGNIVSAAYIPEEKKVKHILTDSFEGVRKCRKSKYVQSDPSIIYDAVKNVGDNRLLVVGTPCQISPLFLKYGNRENILFVDLFCHGVSNAGVFRAYLNTIKKEIRWLDFRCQSRESGNNNFNFKLYFSDFSASVESCDENLFYRLYIASANMKKSCLDCPFSKYSHLSDITIGDWDDHEYAEHFGIRAAHPSIAAVNTRKGAGVFENIKENMDFCCITGEKYHIKKYYPDHKKMKGEWGYNPESVDPFITDYQTKGFMLAAYHTLENENIRIFDALKLNDKRVWLYGAGKIGKRICNLIKYFYTGCIICGFIESSDDQPKKEVLSLPVYGLSGMKDKYKKDDIFIITARIKYHDIMRDCLVNIGVNIDRIITVKGVE